MHRPDLARKAFLDACRLDVETAKPGNVSVDRAGHGMSASQFIASAEASVDALFAHGKPVGERILDAVIRTRQAVGCNTNLGILLLVAPLAAALDKPDAHASAHAWHAATECVLAALTIDDARHAYHAIALANPGGLGDAPEQSVHALPTVTLREAMRLAASRDSIARQYAKGFHDVFFTGLAAIESWSADAAPGTTPDTTVTLDLYLTYLSRWPDSHIVRKHGEHVAQSVTQDAGLRHARWRADAIHARDACQHAYPSDLAEWDLALKSRGINPGTSADLTVATLFVSRCLTSASNG
ncbi:triphosphoribosyl-dephospho-CoA synthase [Paraburkholderia sp.]|uniref:triphosphoribosyl-dephospho-CoA synthase n=1 Tax=Paraburkholderia sp. TaxID=1926495 RepID=UPI002382828D|nr:triphosphoribosyl-dephospho-CoA synthase [Paraburkholderia sp.]MDE1179151.1 triphosphoribosyl-dephospho-CoA synthase [Paraburkholderia sp.]